MTKVNYKIYPMKEQITIEELNTIGKQDWELIQVLYTDYNGVKEYTYYFKYVGK